MSNLNKLANSFVEYFKKFNIKHIPEDFIREYYILTHGNYISIVEFIKWLDINRQTMIDNLNDNYKLNKDYFIITKNEEVKCLKLYNQDELTFKPNQKFIKLTQKCFKEICMKSSTDKGEMIRNYYMDLDELFKKFHLDKIDHISEENETLKNNQKSNKKIIHNKEGIYVWTNSPNKSSVFRIGRANNVNGRINDHNSSNVDKIKPLIIVYMNHSELVEKLLKHCLEKYLYRGEFYKCNINSIRSNISIICKFLQQTNNKFVYNKNFTILYNSTKSYNKKNPTHLTKKSNNKIKSKKSNSKIKSKKSIKKF